MFAALGYTDVVRTGKRAPLLRLQRSADIYSGRTPEPGQHGHLYSLDAMTTVSEIEGLSPRAISVHNVSSRLLRVTIDGIMVTTASALSVFLRFRLEVLAFTEADNLTVGAHLVPSIVWGLGLIAMMWRHRLYDEDTLFPGGGEMSRLLKATIEGAAFFSAFVFLTQAFFVSRTWFAITVTLSAASAALGRLGVRWFLARSRLAGRRQRPVLLVEADDQRDGGWSLQQVPEFRPVGRVDIEGLKAQLATESAPRPSEALFRERVALMVPAPDIEEARLWPLIMEAGEKGHPVYIHAPVRGVRRDRLTVRELGQKTIVKIAPPRLTGARAVQKRGFDLVVSLVGIALFSPLALLIGLAVLIDSGRPILYRQTRTGAGGRAFSIIKFRSMRTDAESGSGPVWSGRGDNRTTRVGRFLRRTSLDELPQLWNVLLGEMSLVGPRPERPPFVERFSREVPLYAYRHRIRPGMTGWAQSHGHRGDTPLDPRIEHDNWYIEHWSIGLDITILCRTVMEVLRGERGD